MRRYVLRRASQAAVVCLAISAIVFVILRLSGDPVFILLPPDASPEEVQGMRTALGLDKPLGVQYLRFLERTLRGDFGTSLYVREPVFVLIRERVPATVQLALTGIAVAILLAVPLGVLASLKRGTLIDNALSVLALGGQAMPTFWLGIMLIIVFGVRLRVLPPSGRGTFAHLVLPALCLGSYLAPVLMRLMRSKMLEVLNEDYIRTARSKGLSEVAVFLKHALRNAAIPVVTVLGLQLGRLMGGAIIVETVFAWPGLGSLTVNAIMTHDYPVVQASVMALAAVIVFANLATDIANSYIDPRIRLT